MQKLISIVIIVLLSLSFTNQATNAVQAPEIRYLNPDAGRELELRLHTQLTGFDPTTKKADFDLDWSIHDVKTKKPLESIVRVFPYGGGTMLNVENDSSGFPMVGQTLSFHDIPTFPRYTALNSWPYEEYVVQVFLQFNDTVTLKQLSLDTIKTGTMTNNMNWNVKTLDYESSSDEMTQKLPVRLYSDQKIGSVFKYEIVITTSSALMIKNSLYAFVSIIPIILIVAHIGFVRKKKLSTQMQLFIGVTVLLITGLFTNRPLLPPDITLFELILGGSVGVYTVWFFRLLYKKSQTENQSCEHKIYR